MAKSFTIALSNERLAVISEGRRVRLRTLPGAAGGQSGIGLADIKKLVN